MNFIYPVGDTARVTQTFDQHIEYAERWDLCTEPGQTICPNGRYYGGIDYGVVTGTPVKCGQYGVVSDVRRDTAGYGWHVRVQHQEGYISIYAHLSRIDVVYQQEIKAGQIIGLSGWTGNVRPPGQDGQHLHFEVRLNNKPINPQPLLVKELIPINIVIPEMVPLPKFMVLADSLKIRETPIYNYSQQPKVLGLVVRGTILDMTGYALVGDDIWIKIGYKQYCAMRYKGYVFATFI